MKNLLLAISIAGFLMSCDSNKGGFKSSRKAQSSVIAPKAKTQNTNNSVSRINEPVPPMQPLDPNPSRLDSIVTTTSDRLPYDRAGIMTPGVSGVGTGGSYASVYYRGKPKKTSAKPAVQPAAVVAPQTNTDRVIALADSASASQSQASTDTTGLNW